MKPAASHTLHTRVNAHSSRASAAGESHGTAHLPFGDAAFAAVFDSSAEALLVVNAKGIIQRANPRASEMLHRQESELVQAELGKFLMRPSSEEFSRLCALQAGSNALSMASGLLVSGFPVRISFRASLDGAQNLVLCLEEGSVVQRAEAKWMQVEAELTSVLDSMETGTILLDAAGRIRFCNARFGQYFGMERRQLQSLGTIENLIDLVAPRFRTPEKFSAPWKVFAAGQGVPGHDELEMMRPTRRILGGLRARCWTAKGVRWAGWNCITTSRASGRFSRSCCKRKKWLRWGNSFPE